MGSDYGSLEKEFGTQENSIKVMLCKPSVNCKTLLIFSIAEILVGFTLSLLAPFYTEEATSKGLTVTQTGMVSYSF